MAKKELVIARAPDVVQRSFHHQNVQNFTLYPNMMVPGCPFNPRGVKKGPHPPEGAAKKRAAPAGGRRQGPLLPRPGAGPRPGRAGPGPPGPARPNFA